MTVLHYYRGRVALHAILEGLGIAPGDEVVVQAYTCAAVVEPLRRLGLRPVYVDIDRYTRTMDLDLLGAALTVRTRAVVVQHTFGVPVDLAAVLAITGPAGVPVIEDCAHVTSGPARGPLGAAGVAAFFSYEWGKPVVAGVGGLAVVNDEALAAVMQARYAGYTAPPVARELVMSAQYLAYRAATRAGLVWRLRALYRRLSALGLIVGSYDADPDNSREYGWRMCRTVRWRLPGRIRRAQAAVPGRHRLAERLRTALDELGLGELDARPRPVPSRVAVVVADKARVLREAAGLRVELGDWFATPVHPLAGEQLTDAGYVPGSCPNAEWAAEHVVTLPVRADIRTAEVDRALRLLTRFKARSDV
ncbi:DegT/DnrJ/EryC1/StrS family aminotransferase [Micromonosporaceae bacterium Da 78-11]